MPIFRYSGPYGKHYPESRDARDIHVGEVEPGDTRELNEPLDGDWVPVAPADDPDRPAKSAPKEDWKDYATSTGLADPGEADGLTKAQLQELAAPDGKAAKTTDTKAGAPGKEG